MHMLPADNPQLASYAPVDIISAFISQSIRQ